MQRTRIQRGGVNLDISSSGKSIWVFRWRVTLPDGRRVMRKRVIGTLERYRTKNAAENAARVLRMNLLDGKSAALTTITMRDLVVHFREQELVDRGEDGKAYPSPNEQCFALANYARLYLLLGGAGINSKKRPWNRIISKSERCFRTDCLTSGHDSFAFARECGCR